MNNKSFENKSYSNILILSDKLDSWTQLTIYFTEISCDQFNYFLG